MTGVQTCALPILSLDNQIVNQGYVSRSEFMRDLIREQLVEDRWNRSLINSDRETYP